MPTTTGPLRAAWLVRAVLALLALGLLLLGAAPVSAQTGDPVFVLSRLSCVGDDVRGTVSASGDGRTVVRVALVARFGGGPYRGTGLLVDLLPTPTTTAYSYSFNVASLPPGATDYRVEVGTLLDKAKKSKRLSDDACAPGAVVPEVPSALLLPLTMGLTVALVLRRRALGAAAR